MAAKPNNVGLVNNLQSTPYWSGAEYSPGSGSAWYFLTDYGYQSLDGKDPQFYAWAVRPRRCFRSPSTRCGLVIR